MKQSQEICLALDTALEACSVGLAQRKDGVVQSSARHLPLGRGHAERLMGELSLLLEAAGLSYQDLTRLAVTVGPGSFTGLRVGLATARALAMTLDLPLIGLSTLQALALNAQKREASGPVACLIDARRAQVYGQVFDWQGPGQDPIPLTMARAASASELARDCRTHGVCALVGNGAGLVVQSDQDLSALPVLDPATPDMEALALWALDQPASPMPPSPLYLRAPDAKPQRAKSIARRP